MRLSIVVLALVTLQRLGELAVARRNTARLLARGGVEWNAGQHRFFVALHAAWLAGLWALAWDRPAKLAWLAVFGLLFVLRVWTLASLGGRWTTRIITLPGEPLVRRGPYRWIAHPNYLVVAGEVAVLPLMFGLWAYALAFSVLNAVLLSVRIRAESAALKASQASAA